MKNGLTSPTTSTPAQPQRSGAARGSFITILAATSILIGISQIGTGLRGASEGTPTASADGTRNSPEFRELLGKSDKAVTEAKRLSREATALLNQLTTDLDRLGLDVYRAQQKESATKTSELFASAAEQFAFARARVDEARPLNKLDRLTPFLAGTSQAANSFAQVARLNQEIVRMMGDPAISTIEMLVPKLREVAARRDAAQASGQVAAKEANNIHAQLNKEAQDLRNQLQEAQELSSKEKK